MSTACKELSAPRREQERMSAELLDPRGSLTAARRAFPSYRITVHFFTDKRTSVFFGSCHHGHDHSCDQANNFL
jgi:hypothetical protein